MIVKGLCGYLSAGLAALPEDTETVLVHAEAGHKIPAGLDRNVWASVADRSHTGAARTTYSVNACRA